MKKRYFARVLLWCLVIMVTFLFPQTLLSAEKLKFASSIKLTPNYYLPALAAEEKGFWKQNDLDVEWVPFSGSVPMVQGMAGGHVNLGFIPSMGGLEAIARGVPLIMVSELISAWDFKVWVRADSRIKEPKDLKGTKQGVTQLGGPGHAYGRLMAKAIGLEKDIKFVGMGGIPNELAGLKTGAVDGIVEPLTITINLKVMGEVREVLTAGDFLPKERSDHIILARKDFIKKEPEQVKKVLKSVLQAVAFIRENPAWTIDKMKSFQGLSDAAARLLYPELRYTKDGRLDRKAIENLRNFAIEYDLLPREKVPPVEELYAREFSS